MRRVARVHHGARVTPWRQQRDPAGGRHVALVLLAGDGEDRDGEPCELVPQAGKRALPRTAQQSGEQPRIVREPPGPLRLDQLVRLVVEHRQPLPARDDLLDARALHPRRELLVGGPATLALTRVVDSRACANRRKRREAIRLADGEVEQESPTHRVAHGNCAGRSGLAGLAEPALEAVRAEVEAGARVAFGHRVRHGRPRVAALHEAGNEDHDRARHGRSMIPINRTYAPIQAFVDELARCGLEHAVTSPGSRNAPLALTLAAEPRIRAHSVLDERAAGFVALGIAKATGRPVAVTCTSGTAAANLLPAVAEAHEARGPLVVMPA